MKLDISNIDDYNIAAALTGPGIPELDTLKVLITGEIRRVCGMPGSSGPLVREGPTDFVALRQCVYWLCDKIPEHRYLRYTVVHWLSHVRRALFLLGCAPEHWLYRFTRLLGEMVYNPDYPNTVDRINRHLRKFTEEGSRIGGKE